MKPGIRFAKEWADEDMVELRIEISDGISAFTNRIYVAHHLLREVVQGLRTFKKQIYGGIFNLRFANLAPSMHRALSTPVSSSENRGRSL